MAHDGDPYTIGSGVCSKRAHWQTMKRLWHMLLGRCLFLRASHHSVSVFMRLWCLVSTVPRVDCAGQIDRQVRSDPAHRRHLDVWSDQPRGNSYPMPAELNKPVTVHCFGMHIEKCFRWKITTNLWEGSVIACLTFTYNTVRCCCWSGIWNGATPVKTW